MSKKIVVFADGTGNAFSVRETNVWRLYQALDQTQPDQIAHYIEGVGTSKFKPFALLDGATGIGVPSNVRKLYRFISWNWKPGDEIYMFGFSRGAFTIRALIGLMHYEGLIPTIIDGEPVPREEMRRNAMGAWRSYRSKTVSWKNSLPTIGLTRLVRDAFIGLYHFVTRQTSYSTVADEIEAQGRVHVPIKFVGLFDTVEAYGVPLEEFRRAIDVAIWPISFKNRLLSEHVQCARHALSLDDERVTFHPLRFDLKHSKHPERIKEVWFAGVHSDVGGGYPEDDLAQVPLTWITGELGSGLRFIPGAADAFTENASPYAAAHDSRAGLAVFYRYGPRKIGYDGGPPVIHHSVAEKIAFGIERYAPVTLPDTAHVLMPDGTNHAIKGFDHKKLAPPNVPPPPVSPQMALAVKAVESLSQPDPAIVSLTLDNVWCRRVAYFSLLFAAFLVALLPWTVRPAVTAFRDMMHRIAGWVGLTTQWDTFWDWASSTDQGGSAFLGSIFQLIGTALPGYAKPWAEALIDRPTACGIVIVLALILYSRNSSLRDRIADLARQAWLPSEKTSATEDQKKQYKEPIPDTFAKRIRESKFADLIECAVSRYALPSAAIVLIYAAVAVSISNSTIILREGSGGICKQKTTDHPPKLGSGKIHSRDDFTTDQLCWATGVSLEQGQHYTLWIEMTEPSFFDRAIMTDIAGFKDASFIHLLALPIRRWWSADWFQPIARIGNTGTDAWPLISADGDTAIPTGLDAAGNPMPKHFYDDKDYVALATGLDGGTSYDSPIPPAELPAAEKIRAKYQLRKIYASNFTAHSDGQLFLYVNDALAAIPFWKKTIDGFYKNNTGKAKVTIKHLSSPPPS